ncbi:MAG: hypothetical protein JO119_05060, partial [Acidobacteria bacterium]|nr:hypothetical protein [Acidobacteriota bacterium]
MERQHILFSWRIGSTRYVFALSLLLVAGLGCANASRAQSETLNVSRVVDANAIEGGLRAHIAALPSAPTPKVEPAASVTIQAQPQTQIASERKHRFYSLGRSALTYGLVQGGAEIFDGLTTRHFVDHCSHCFENDPMSRLLLGTHPSWGKMIPMGFAEATVSTYCYQRMSRSPHRILRTAAPFLPLGLTAVHVIEGARNITLKNRYRCADPGYVVVGSVCVPAPLPTLVGTPDTGGTGF